jgi:hypothetical protein
MRKCRVLGVDHLSPCRTAGMTKEGGLSKFFDDIFDEAYNETVIANDLPDVRWGRIDYLNVTYLTTKWIVWQYVPDSITAIHA